MLWSRFVGSIFAIVVMVSVLSPGAVSANLAGTNYSAVCDTAATRAAREFGVPEAVLQAITRTETARYGHPWPWTVNMEGTGHWFETRAEAEEFAERRMIGGAQSFDIGCFQINHRWHGEHFDSIEAMFEPEVNARYAARFLIELFAEFGSWDAAVGAYHSRTERYAARYLRIYHGHLEDLGASPEMPPPGLAAQGPERSSPNGFPLLQAGGETSLGSLVPGMAGATQPLFGARP